ncbi:hypothetical protein AHMF7605_16410 [Adhaeribacter arboris]|uniref:DUF418 domain-containing protein n=1 Tax=Adhaeribacter arboris TaxID=2072846 RepID=A0A2T2YHK2_9BACT|nr:hypothetical protein AHMF7605_16410 [Adhaeribacter arboris]
MPGERYRLLDVLRGFALLGVLVANMATLSGYFFLTEEAKKAFSSYPTDHFISSLLLLIIDGKFYSLFSLLFGIGFGLQLQRSFTSGMNFPSLFRRRLLILLILGLCHAIFLYPGDILTVYALLGFVLLLFRNFSDKNLLRAALILLLLPLIQYAIMLGVHFVNPPLPKPAGPRMLDQMIQMFRTGSYLDIIKANLGGLIFGRYPDLLFTGRFFKVLAMFLMGFYIARNKIYAQVSAYRPLLKKVILGGVIIGIPCNLVLATMVNMSDYKELQPAGIIQPLAYAYGVPALCLGYAAIFALLYEKPAWKKRFAFFAPVGQIALSNYLLQSLICVFIFKSYGFAMEAQVGPTKLLLIAFAIYSSQVIFSHIWVRYFFFGPAEWLWRSLTYKAWQPLRKSRFSNQSIAVS